MKTIEVKPTAKRTRRAAKGAVVARGYRGLWKTLRFGYPQRRRLSIPCV